jgi:RNA polymerase subunit RPABC4/transcription elongation factor Spt4
MPTFECKDCKKMVSPSAETCPFCGAKYPVSYITSKVIIHRKSAYSGSIQVIEISVDDNKIGKLYNDQTLTLNLPCGDHIIKGSMFMAGSNQLLIKILPNKLYKIEFHWRWSAKMELAYTISDIQE